MDIAKKHVIRTEHVDKGMRVADYPVIQVTCWCPPLLSLFSDILFGLREEDSITS